MEIEPGGAFFMISQRLSRNFMGQRGEIIHNILYILNIYANPPFESAGIEKS